jgi:hypothetical protein
VASRALFSTRWQRGYARWLLNEFDNARSDFWDAAGAELAVQGQLAIVKTAGAAVSPNADFDPDWLPKSESGEVIDPPCRVGSSETTVSVYHLDTGQRILLVESYSRTPASVAVNSARTTATISGPDCDTTLAL